MATVTFKSIDKTARTATFDVDGVDVTRGIPDEFYGTIDDYLTALGNGLLVEAEAAEAKATKKEITDPESVTSGKEFSAEAEEK